MASFIKRVAKHTPKNPSPKKKWRFKLSWRWILRAAIIGLVCVLVFAALLFAWYYKDLPKPGELRTHSTSESTLLYDQKGRQIFDISGDQQRIVLTSNQIPQDVKNATVAVEDHNFYHHHGIDLGGLIRGVILRPLMGKSPQGGSTITQQYIKNAILSPQRTVTRKIKEIILALELETIYTKDQILTLYLNEIPYGSNVYGVEAASQAYFGKSAKDGLTLGQAATLAAIINAPTTYSPYGSHVDLLIDRKNLVLDDMAKYGYITQAQADQAKKEAPLVASDFVQKRQNYPAPHFAEYVREELVDKYGEDLVQRGGLRVTTSLDLDVQAIADAAVKDQVKTLHAAKASNAGLVAIDPKTGEILAMVGSVDYFDREHEGNFNVATSPNRQPGSAGKPIVYATLFDKQDQKWSPSSVLWDVQTSFNGYKPGNFDGKFRGPVTIRSALGNSLNVPAVKALQIEGINNFLATARNLGITTLDNQKNAGLSLALGGGSVKLVDLTAAYSVFANGGTENPAVSILKIQDSSGKTLYQWKPEPKQVIKPEIAYEINNVLSDLNAKKPTFGRLLGILSVPGKTVAAKTGTSNDYKDAWTMGYTPSLVAGVWAGNNDGSEMDHGGGSTVAAPIWHEFMTKALANKKNESFPRPDDVVDHTVDLLSGKDPTPASGQLVQDIFAPWQLPNASDDLHKQVKVCKSNGLLATDATPPEEIDTKVFVHVHSEHPDDADWEGPVQAWAKANNLASDPPTQTCDITFQNPKVTITNPANNDTVSGIFTATADVTFPPNVTGTVQFALDGNPVSTSTSEPYSATIDATNLPQGPHQITATATGSNGATGSDSISVTIGGDTNPPGEATNITITPLIGGRAHVTWTNPSDSDLASVIFYASQASGVKGSKVAEVPVSPGAPGSTTISGLQPGVVNYITLAPTDKSGNSNPTTTQNTVTPL